MATLKELNSQLAAAQKKHGAKSQAAGRIQYKINQLNKDSKGTAVKTKTGVLKSKTGVVRQKDATKKKRKPAVQKLTMDRNPNTVAKKKADKPKSNVTVTPYKAAKITDLSANKRAGQVRKDASPSGAAASRKLYEQKQANKKKIATLQDTMKRMKASGSTAADLVNIKTKIAKLKG